jgi:hypothetical protein
LDLWPRDLDTAGGKIRILTGRHRVFTTYSSNNFGQPMSD